MLGKLNLLTVIFAVTCVGCGENHSPQRKDGIRSTQDQVKASGQTSVSQETTGKVANKDRPSNQPQEEATDEQPNLPPLGPSKLAWNGEDFMGSSTFALIPLE